MKLTDHPAILFPGAMLLGIALFAAPTVIISLVTQQPLALAPSAAAVRLCDEAVEALLHSKELIEVQRAAAIVHEIPCSIDRRLPPD